MSSDGTVISSWITAANYSIGFAPGFAYNREVRVWTISHTDDLKKGKSISGEVNIPYGTILQEHEKFLYLNDKPICCVTSENGWEHFRPNTDEGQRRQEMLEKLYRWYAKARLRRGLCG